MPRGNDSDAALHELADKFGKGVGNAERLIEATLASRTQLLRTAEQLPVSAKLTAELDLSKLEGPNGEKVVSGAVHQSGVGDPITVIVFVDDRDALHVAALDDKDKVVVDDGAHPASSSRKLDPDDEAVPVNGPPKDEQAAHKPATTTVKQ